MEIELVVVIEHKMREDVGESVSCFCDLFVFLFVVLDHFPQEFFV